MTTAAVVLVALASVFAVGNWWSRARDDRRVEYVTKPAVTALLALAAVALDPSDPAMRWWFVAAFVLCLAGDVFLMLPQDLFVPGLASFLLGHVAFGVGFAVGGLDQPWVAAVTAVALVALLAFVGRQVLVGARRRDPALAVPVAAYLFVIAAMAVLAGWHGNAWGLAGAGAFVVSDSILGFDRFVRALPWAPVAIMVTYHAALFGLLFALA
jgi:uncharacterized membrane protein YhhN